MKTSPRNKRGNHCRIIAAVEHGMAAVEQGLLEQVSMATHSYFKTEDKLNDKSDYHAQKMTLDLTLEEHEVLDSVQGKVVEPPSNAPATARTKY